MRNVSLSLAAGLLISACSVPPSTNYRANSQNQSSGDSSENEDSGESDDETGSDGEGEGEDEGDGSSSGDSSDSDSDTDEGETGTDEGAVGGTPGDGATPSDPSIPADPKPVDPKPDTTTPDSTKPDSSGEAIKGHLDLSFTVVGPSSAGQFRRSGHIRAVWITDAKNTYIRTLDYRASKRAQYLKRYNSFMGSVIDGSSGATDKSLASPLSAKVSWDMKSNDGKAVAAGSYKIWFEMAEANVSGNFSAPADGKQSFDNSAGYAYHVVNVVVDNKAASTSDAKSPVFTAINLVRRLD